ncbi:hypothetical protein FJT64_022944 [Amphibalanus amphitrite]|uniref:C-type lectin domain-containing protein n=1 Tax=Amphibalanus amphitrite TaxID=1232801 RepID=A0A6A4WCF8_AMPAM|nr:hypothetical protein FJT64_022944 [Amphibalanus amphitrite]
MKYLRGHTASKLECGSLCVQQPLCRVFRRDSHGDCRLYRGLSLVTPFGVEPGQRSYRRIGRCPPDYIRCTSTEVCLRRLPGTTSYKEALAACERLGTRLTLPRSQAHNECLRNMYRKYGNSLWLGAVDKKLDNTYIGIDGLGEAPDDPRWWGTGENHHPGNSVDLEPHVVMKNGWADVSERHAAEAVCETPLLY